MSKLNIIMTDFLSLLRRVLGSSDGNGELILITQLSRRLDIIAKEMATNVRYMVHYYTVKCSCGYTKQETNENPQRLQKCPLCFNYRLKKVNHYIHVLEFRDVDNFEAWKNNGIKTYYVNYIIKDIESIFNDYDTLQFEDMFSQY